jgi:hypothetical protein
MPKPKTVQTAFRFPKDLVGKIDRFARDLEREHSLELTKPITRAEAVRVLILRGLEFSRFQRDKSKMTKSASYGKPEKGARA